MDHPAFVRDVDKTVDSESSAPGAGSAGTSHLWIPLPLVALLERSVRRTRPVRRLVLIWGAFMVLSIAVTAALGDLNWHGFPVRWGWLRLDVTLSPPLLVGVPALLWLGPAWAMVPAYVTGVAAGVASGVSLPAALALGLACPLTLAVFVPIYRVVPLRTDMRSVWGCAAFAVVSMLAAEAGSIAALARSWALGADPEAVLAAWRGWWVGAVGLAMVPCLAVLAIFGRRVAVVRERWLPVGERQGASRGWTRLAVLAVCLPVLVEIGASGWLLASRVQHLAPDGGAPSSAAAVALLLHSVRSLAVVALLMVAGVGVFWVALAGRWRHAVASEVRGQTERLRIENERLSLASEGARDGLWDWDVVGGRVHFSPHWRAMVGYGDSALGDTMDAWFSLVDTDDRERLEAALAAHSEGHTSHFEAEYRVHHRDGTVRWMLARAQSERRGDGAPARIAGIQRDITEAKLAEQQLVRDALHDGLTGLPNRALFLDRLAGAIARSRRHSDYRYAVLFLDLDRFKVINDSLGHGIGDQLLVAISERLVACVRPGDTVARMGGDEFAVLLDHVTTTDNVTDLAQRIQEKLARPFMLQGNEVFTSASIGIAASRRSYQSPEEVLRAADTAMYRAKNLGKARHQVFDTSMHARAMRQLLLETDLRRAAERDQLELRYQPIVSLGDRRIVGVEALLRWNHPRWGAVPQGEFLPLADETGLIVAIGKWVLARACADLASWKQRSAACSDLTVAVNVAGRQLAQPEFSDLVERTVSGAGLTPRAVRLEISESAIIDGGTAAHAQLALLAGGGVRIDVDDFGSGYASLTTLQRVPVGRVKVHRSLVGSLCDDAESARTVRAIVSLARSLEVVAVAVGVESEGQAEMLGEMGCALAQGFLFARPAAGDEIEGLLSR